MDKCGLTLFNQLLL